MATTFPGPIYTVTTVNLALGEKRALFLCPAVCIKRAAASTGKPVVLLTAHRAASRIIAGLPEANASLNENAFGGLRFGRSTCSERGEGGLVSYADKFGNALVDWRWEAFASDVTNFPEHNILTLRLWSTRVSTGFRLFLGGQVN